jgi:hypothetical protein
MHQRRGIITSGIREGRAIITGKHKDLKRENFSIKTVVTPQP